MGLKIANGATEYVKFKYVDPQLREFRGSEQISHKVSHYSADGWVDAYLDASPKLQEALDAAAAGVDATMAIGRTGEGKSTRWTVSLYEHGPKYSPGFNIQGGTSQAAAMPPSAPPNGAPPQAGNNTPPQAGGPPAAPQAGGPPAAQEVDVSHLCMGLLVCRQYVEKFFVDASQMDPAVLQDWVATLFIECNKRRVNFTAARDKIAGGLEVEAVEKVAQTFDAELVSGPPTQQAPPPSSPPPVPTTAAADDDLPF